MEFMQVNLVTVLLVAFGFSEAQRPKLLETPDLSRLQPLQALQPLWSGGARGLSPGSQGAVPWRPAPAQPQLGPQPPGQTAQQWDPSTVQFRQALQGPVKKVTWRFPQVLLPTRQPPVPFEMRQPAPVNSVAAACGEHSIYVEVRRDLFGTGELISPLDITLGGCAVSGEDAAAQVLMFESELQACHSALRMTEDELVYSFSLLYAPNTIAPDSPIVRSNRAVIRLECHYPRIHNVSSNALLPAWIPYASTQVAEERLLFSLRLMIDDWASERPSNQYFLGEFINIEASVMQFNHVLLRVHVDSCVATAVPDVNAVPRYSFIDNYGCLLDAKVTGSKSHFMPQSQADKLQFQLEAFRFQEETSGLIYLTCFMKANAAASSPADAEHKACSFPGNRWVAAYGDNQVCSCCDTRCSVRKGRDLSNEGLHLEREVTLGPIMVKDSDWDSASEDSK
ncbi:zona pellucida sperm-binding protein 3-like [Astyanax mexicanus]|uniref:Zona pellucida sperm-binding protein 3 n=2 Tax=Astyanax mexicanus TaxID=7994 RepID=A0A8B9L9A4_ASTMX|nr:zona pellucida sperm-binding protein 3-like [Astyanax mexicanus]